MIPETFRPYLMNCDVEAWSDDTQEDIIKLAEERKNSEKYWRDRISHEAM